MKKERTRKLLGLSYWLSLPPRRRFISLARVIVLLFIITIVLVPFYISFLYSIKSHSDISLNRLAWPKHPTLENYARVIKENKYVAIGFKNSILTTIPTTLILLFTTSMASYVLARNNTPFYKMMYTIFISGILVPFQCIMLPLYMNIYNLGLVSTNLGFILARSGFQVSISVLSITGFIKGIPRELEQAASIDGCGKIRTFWRIVFPLMTPINVTQMVLNTLFVWNDYSTAVVLLRDDTSRTLPLAQIIYFGENMTELNLAFAFFTLAMIPILILYLSTQRYIVSGIMSGAVKG
ncbi:MAG TPA: carbohydrate ABC transporter permease [Christensenellaceae bacterium]|jgi:raffinose/stachyose/melibiose transport system permease protein|nr:carbohydrate ABC transporter permease [Christensenellaceae bacterium]